MRRLEGPDDGETGGIAVIVALLMVVLLGFAAIAVDVGMLYSERAQLQNGADAVALGVARKCATVSPTDACAAVSDDVQMLADGNAVDGHSIVRPIALSLIQRRATVTASAQEDGSRSNTVSLFFARALGFNSTEVDAVSSVRWGSPLEGITPFPLAFSVCQFSLNKGTQLLEAHNSNDNSNNDKGTPDCIYAGKPVPGGFNWTAQAAGLCGSSINLSLSTSYSNTGNDAPGNCQDTLKAWADTVNAGREVVVLLPVFDSASGTGSSAKYHLTAFAAFKVQGWSFSGVNKLPFSFGNVQNDKGPTCTGNCRGIIGSFINYVSLSEGYTLGPISAYGAAVVELTS
jgi:hypothetical protein